MKTKPRQHPKKTTGTQAERDSIIANALSSSLAKTKPTGPCPAVGEMAEFIDGNTSEQERQHILGHLAVCDRCREIHILAHELGKAEPVRRVRTGWYIAGASLASAALVILVLNLTIQQTVTPGQQVAQTPTTHRHIAMAPQLAPKPSALHTHERNLQPLPFSTTLAAGQLARTASADSLAATIGVPASGSNGFAGNNNRQATAFKAGKELFELELWLAAGDKERAGLAVERLAPLLRSVGGNAVEAPLKNLLQQLESEENVAKLGGAASQLEAMLENGDRRIVLLGGWAAAARVAIGVGKDPYFSCNPPEIFRRDPGTKLNSGARGVLRKMSRQKPATDPEQMKRLLDELTNTI